MTLALLTGCGTANLPENLAADQTTAPLAVLEGEELSPDGQFEVQIVGASNIVNGIQVPEKIQVVDQETGEVMWEDQGWGTQSVLWSPGQSLPGSGIRCLYLASSTYHRD